LSSASAVVRRDVRIGLALEQPLVGRTGDPFQHGAYLGMVRAARNLHVQAKLVAPNPTGPDQFVPPISYLARQRYDLVIATGSFFLPALAAVAPRFPSVKFAVLDARRSEFLHPPPNVEGTLFHTEQAAFLAGYLAARMVDRRPGPHVISSVAGVPIPPVKAYVAGFQAGAKRADPAIELLNDYTYDFNNPANCERAALDQIARGSRVVFDVAGACGVGALEAARRKGIWGIGVDIDQSYLGKFVLTSVVKALDVAVYRLASLLVGGKLPTGGDLEFDLQNHGVKLGRFSPQVPTSLRQEVERLQTQIVQGRIVVPTTLSSRR
jgi:basic membrane protein A and related proteins